ncbi:quinoprotein dehydrogenase-associated putative ABC transporter substrate-binding protein [Caenimonas sp. DR4.4]|uniref:Quinoprotein dehydrogenase-associated putative ABC transporter substrate-binding protein n=2 Tax=Caenimonas aquaedulcis TaxID=2793270 RepID=A0A931H2Z8_9BURK|nr:quinoprotein dehydrogenase-associated putative ABC transporter substrate-binding protein [Caenimonas aquaedulcis]
MRRLLAAACMAALASGAAAGELPATLRVCADPDNLPYSHANGSGFENRIAQLVADDLKLPLEYEWLPDRRGFVRKTLGARLCDVIMGVPAGFERAMTTRPYYRSSYVVVDHAGGAPIASFDDPRLARMRLGVQLIGNDLAASPPGQALARHGQTDNVRGFAVPGEEPAAARIVHAIESGELDGAIVWGPQAGFFAAHSRVPLRVHAIAAPAGPGSQPFAYDIAMGVRRGDRELQAALDGVIERRQADIARILADYAVPQVAGAAR